MSDDGQLAGAPEDDEQLQKAMQEAFLKPFLEGNQEVDCHPLVLASLFHAKFGGDSVPSQQDDAADVAEELVQGRVAPESSDSKQSS